MQEDQEKGRMLTPAEVARIWNERAQEMGFTTHYNRFSVRQRHRKGRAGLVPALQTPMGYLYWERDAREIKLYPKKGKHEQTEPRIDEDTDKQPIVRPNVVPPRLSLKQKPQNS